MVLAEAGLSYLWSKILTKIEENTGSPITNPFTEEDRKKLDAIDMAQINLELSSLSSRITTLESKNIIVKATYYEFPNIGQSNCFYVDTANGTLYIWDELNYIYNPIKSEQQKIDIINGGNANG